MTKSSWRRSFAEEVYHNAIRRTLEKTEALERHVKTVTIAHGFACVQRVEFTQW